MKNDANQSTRESSKDRILFSIDRIAIGAMVKWDRKFRELSEDETQLRKEDDGNHNSIKYVSRLLVCTRCGS